MTATKCHQDHRFPFPRAVQIAHKRKDRNDNIARVIIDAIGLVCIIATSIVVTLAAGLIGGAL